jgi:hypothetical protein
MVTLENKNILRLKKFVQNKFPSVIPRMQKILSRTIGFKQERAYLNGKRNSALDLSSIALLSQPRAGTQVCEHVISRLYNHLGGQTIYAGKYLFWHSPSETIKLTDSEWLEKNIEQKGYFYGNLGPVEALGKLSEIKIICMVRDPRDALLSHYFSVKHGHTLAGEGITALHEIASAHTLDEYVLHERSLRDVWSFIEQGRKFRKEPNVLFRRYEDLMHDPKAFLKDVSDFIGIEIEESFLDVVCEESFGDRVEAEDPARHRRSGEWGQFLVKLKPETQDALWKEFGEVICDFGYQKNSLSKISDE